MFVHSSPRGLVGLFVSVLLAICGCHLAAAAELSISGSPRTSVYADAWYVFTPDVAGADGDDLTFTIINKPSWAGFVSRRGELWGRPGPDDVGTYWGIRIRVSDGTRATELPSFPIKVSAAGSTNLAPKIADTPSTSADGGGSSNSSPTISGAPRTSVTAGKWYKFLPTANDPNGDSLTFSIANLPRWAGFVPSRGELWGRPGAGDVGTYDNIRISVSDGISSRSLPAFRIAVTPSGSESGSATLSWQPPTRNEDGSPLTDLAGYVVYWGTASGQYSHSVKLNNPGLTRYVVNDLGRGTHYFATKAFNSSGIQSTYSAEARKTIR
jgi:hypothetical protein